MSKAGLMAKFKSISRGQIGGIVFVILFAVVGVYLLTNSHAATPYVSLNADQGTLLPTCASVQSNTSASDGKYVQFNAPNCSGSSSGGGGGGTTLYSGKLLGMNSSFDDAPSGVSNVTILKELGVNSERGEIDFNGSTFGDPINGDGTSANWVGTLTSNKIVPLPIFNQYVEASDINASAYTAGVVSWCESYCAGGSSFTGSEAQYSEYGAQALEILNEPYGNWWGYQDNTTTDPKTMPNLL